MKLNMLSGLDENLPDALGSVELAGLASNSADVESGFLFFGLPGANVDGASFVGEAAERGACAAVVSNTSGVGKVGIPVLKSADPRRVACKCSGGFFRSTTGNHRCGDRHGRQNIGCQFPPADLER